MKNNQGGYEQQRSSHRGVMRSKFETYTGYSRELKMNSKKNVSGVFNGKFLSSLFGGGRCFFKSKFFKGGHLKKSLGNLDVKSYD